jgi:hypothetical protein
MTAMNLWRNWHSGPLWIAAGRDSGTGVTPRVVSVSAAIRPSDVMEHAA